MQFSAATFVLALLPIVLAGPMVKRVPSANCGGSSYSAAQIQQGINNGLDGDAPSSDYPHQYNDYEGFDFSDYCSDSTYQEFPITHSSGGYTGGSPGADRVIYGTQSGQFCGAITHTGASGNNFVSCDY